MTWKECLAIKLPQPRNLSQSDNIFSTPSTTVTNISQILLQWITKIIEVELHPNRQVFKRADLASATLLPFRILIEQLIVLKRRLL